MSATNRGAERIESDNYPTPGWCTRRLLESQAFPMGAERFSHARSVWVDVCAGEGAIVRVLYDEIPAAYVYAVELRAECRAPLTEIIGADGVTIGNYLETPATDRPDVIITNPPFSIAEAVIQKALTEADWCAFLVRQGFVGHERAEWMRPNMPDTYELPDRPSFVASLKCVRTHGLYGEKWQTPGCGWSRMQPLEDPWPRNCPVCSGKVRRTTSDAADYCWLVWTPERNRTEGKRVILADTPASERIVKARAA